jgi:Rieske Fe-S protein
MDAIRSYVLAAYLDEDVPVAFYEDTLNPFHYIRFTPTPEGQLCLIGGEDHQTGTEDAEAKYRLLEAFAKRHFNIRRLEYYWSSQDSYSHDRVPFIGRYLPGSQHLFVATAFGGYGMTHSTIAGQLLADLISNRPNAWSEIYAPQRLDLKTELPNLVKQGASVVKHLALGKLPAAAQSDVDKLVPGEGKVVKGEQGKIAAYRDSHNTLQLVSATCTHMGCTVAFNAAEKSWDCPCHGSRFGTDGQVLHGPATRKLSSYERKT